MYSDGENAAFTRACKAAYLTVKHNTYDPIEIRSEFVIALQQAGRNPTNKFINKYWSSSNSSINFEHFCRILRDEPESTESDLRSAFGKIDANRDGVLSFSELRKLLCQQKDRLTDNEMRQVFNEIDLNKDGKIDYNEFVRMVQQTAEETRQTNIKRMERMDRPKRQEKVAKRRDRTLEQEKRLSIESSSSRRNSNSYKPQQPSSESNSPSPPSRRSQMSNHSRSSRMSTKMSIPDRLSPAPVERHQSPTNSTNSSARSSPRKTKTLTMPPPKSICKPFPDSKKLQQMNVIKRKGCFYYDENSRGEPALVGHRYLINLHQADSVLFAIQPYTNSDMPPLASENIPGDVVLFAIETYSKKVICCTQDKDTQGCFHSQQLMSAGEYMLIPYTTGCRFTPRTQETARANAKAELLEGTGQDMKLTKRFRMVLMNIFDTFDLDDNGCLNREEFNLYNVRTGDEVVTDEEWQVVKSKIQMTPFIILRVDECFYLGNFDTKNGELSIKGFIQLHELEAKDANGDTEDMWVSLQQVGYDYSLQMNEACPFELTIYTEDSECSVKVGEILPLIEGWEYNSILTFLWKESKIIQRESDLTMRYWANGYWTVLLLSSEGNNSTICQLEITSSKNVIFKRVENLDHINVEPFKPKTILYGAPESENENWMFAIDIKR